MSFGISSLQRRWSSAEHRLLRMAPEGQNNPEPVQEMQPNAEQEKKSTKPLTENGEARNEALRKQQEAQRLLDNMRDQIQTITNANYKRFTSVGKFIQQMKQYCQANFPQFSFSFAPPQGNQPPQVSVVRRGEKPTVQARATDVQQPKTVSGTPSRELGTRDTNAPREASEKETKNDYARLWSGNDGPNLSQHVHTYQDKDKASVYTGVDDARMTVSPPDSEGGLTFTFKSPKAAADFARFAQRNPSVAPLTESIQANGMTVRFKPNAEFWQSNNVGRAASCLYNMDLATLKVSDEARGNEVRKNGVAFLNNISSGAEVVSFDGKNMAPTADWNSIETPYKVSLPGKPSFLVMFADGEWKYKADTNVPKDAASWTDKPTDPAIQDFVIQLNGGKPASKPAGGKEANDTGPQTGFAFDTVQTGIGSVIKGRIDPPNGKVWVYGPDGKEVNISRIDNKRPGEISFVPNQKGVYKVQDKNNKVIADITVLGSNDPGLTKKRTPDQQKADKEKLLTPAEKNNRRGMDLLKTQGGLKVQEDMAVPGKEYAIDVGGTKGVARFNGGNRQWEVKTGNGSDFYAKPKTGLLYLEDDATASYNRVVLTLLGGNDEVLNPANAADVPKEGSAEMQNNKRGLALLKQQGGPMITEDEAPKNKIYNLNFGGYIVNARFNGSAWEVQSGNAFLADNVPLYSTKEEENRPLKQRMNDFITALIEGNPKAAQPTAPEAKNENKETSVTFGKPTTKVGERVIMNIQPASRDVLVFDPQGNRISVTNISSDQSYFVPQIEGRYTVMNLANKPIAAINAGRGSVPIASPELSKAKIDAPATGVTNEWVNVTIDPPSMDVTITGPKGPATQIDRAPGSDALRFYVKDPGTYRIQSLDGMVRKDVVIKNPPTEAEQLQQQNIKNLQEKGDKSMRDVSNNLKSTLAPSYIEDALKDIAKERTAGGKDPERMQVLDAREKQLKNWEQLLLAKPLKDETDILERTIPNKMNDPTQRPQALKLIDTWLESVTKERKILAKVTDENDMAKQVLGVSLGMRYRQIMNTQYEYEQFKKKI